LYEAAARSEERKRLENIRRGGLAWLREHVAERPPDIGGPELHPTAGAVIVGARKFLVAFNVNLRTNALDAAHAIARRVRESSGGLPALKAIGVPLPSRDCVQVSMNLTDYERTGIGDAYEAVRRECIEKGIEIAGTELIGLVPRRAWEDAAAHLLHCDSFSASRVLENRLEELSARRSFDEVLDDISNPASPMGGGSAAALTAALGAALGYMVAQLSKLEGEHFRTHREFFASAVARDAEAFNQVSLAKRADDGRRAAALQDALRIATLVPAELTERAKQLDRDLLELKERSLPKLHSDVMTALGLSRAARAGGIAAAKANLQLIDDPAFRQEIERRLESRPGS
jgi:glutamate formiminotransferase / formiminotetrahydrofolate cyclodeaminase